MRIKANNKIHITLLIFALISLFLIVFFVWPLAKEIEKNSEDLISAKNNIVILGEQTSETENFNRNYESYKPNLEKIDQLFVDPNNPVDFIKFLEDSAYASKITSQVSLPSSSQGSKNNSQNYIIVQFSSKGGFSNVLNFLKKIEFGPYLIEIGNLTIQNSNEDSDSKKDIFNNYPSRQVSAAFTIKVFIKK